MRFAFLSLSLCVAVCASADEPLAARVDAYIEPLVHSGLFSGVVLIAKSETPLAVRTYGKASYELGAAMPADARFRIASITKTFTGAAIVMLAERQKLSLDDPLSKYAPAFPSADKITLRHLLLHRSGVPNPKIEPCSDAALDDVVADLAKQPLWFAPGSGNGYSNGGYALLAHVIEKVTGKTWEHALRDGIFTPLGLASTMRDAEEAVVARRVGGYVPAPTRERVANAPCQNAAAAIGSGALLSTAGDLHRWARAVAKETLFKRSALEHPYGWGVRTYHGKNAIEQSGILNGFASYLAAYPDDDVYVVLLSNVQNAELTDAGIGLAAIALGKEAKTLSAPPAMISWTPRYRAPWIGSWRHDGIGTVTIEARGDALYQRWGESAHGSYLFAAGPVEAFNRQEGASMTLDGDVLRISWGGEAEEFRRVR